MNFSAKKPNSKSHSFPTPNNTLTSFSTKGPINSIHGITTTYARAQDLSHIFKKSSPYPTFTETRVNEIIQVVITPMSRAKVIFCFITMVFFWLVVKNNKTTFILLPLSYIRHAPRFSCHSLTKSGNLPKSTLTCGTKVFTPVWQIPPPRFAQE